MKNLKQDLKRLYEYHWRRPITHESLIEILRRCHVEYFFFGETKSNTPHWDELESVLHAHNAKARIYLRSNDFTLTMSFQCDLILRHDTVARQGIARCATISDPEWANCIYNGQDWKQEIDGSLEEIIESLIERI